MSPQNWIDFGLLLIGLGSLAVAVMAYRRSGESLSVDERQALANELMLMVEMNRDTKNRPSLAFTHAFTDTESSHGFGALTLFLENAGDFPLIIEEGDVVLKVCDQIQGEHSHDLAGVKIPGRGRYPVKLEIPHKLLHHGGCGEFPVVVDCHATYKVSEDKSETEHQHYRYSRGHRKLQRFHPKSG
jgi:hypothetical protein